MNRHRWLHSVAPLTVITTAAVVAVGLALLATLLALSQPWLGISFDRSYKGDGLRILKVQDYCSAHRELHSGDVVVALTSASRRVEISALTFEEDPDRLSSYAEYNAFFAHQQVVFDVITSPSLNAVLNDGRTIPLTAKTFPSLDALSWDFGWLLFFGGASLLLGVSAWSMRPRDTVARILAISGIGFMLGAYSCAIYASRELVLPAQIFFGLTTLNHLGIMIFAYASILFFWYYPHPYRQAPAAWIYTIGVLLLWLNETLQLFSWPVHAFYAHFLMAYTLLFSLAILQWRKTRGMPLERAALRWLIVTVLLSLGATVVLFYVPVILTGSPIASNVLTFGSVFLFYLGLVIGNIRYHQFDMDQWWLRAWQWLMFILIAMIADALFIYFLHVTQSVSIVLSIGVGVFYLLTRQWFWTTLSGGRNRALNQALPQVGEALNLQQQGITADMQWDQQLTRIFNPIRLHKLATPCIQATFGEDANTLNIPSLDGLYTIEVFCCEKGRRLFTSTDIDLANRFLELMRKSQEAALSHERGVQEERQRILRDLHDDVAARLLTLLHQTREPEVSNTARNALRGLRDVIDRIGTEEMSLSDVLLDIEAASREQLSGVSVSFEWYAPAAWPELMLSANLHINIRRIVRETIANALKHAHPQVVIMKIELVGGAYSFTNIANGTYTITPSLAGYTFAPTSATVTVNNGNATVPNFVPTAVSVTYSISGTISGNVTAGVTVTLTGAATQTITTAAGGTYSFTGLTNGSYTVTPTIANNTFAPTSTAVTVSGANVTGKNFVASALAAPTYTLSGTVGTTDGVTVQLSGTAPGTTTTTGGGNYSFTNLVAGSYTVTPSLPGYTFAPISRTVTISNAHVTVTNIVPTPPAVTYSIGGAVSGAVTSGVTLTLSGAANNTAITATGGTYSFAGLVNGSYTVTPSLAGYTFTPNSRIVTINNGSANTSHFTAAVSAVPKFMVSGAVTGPWVEGLTINMTGAATGAVSTNAGGNYSFANLPAGSYTFTPAPLAGYSYTPRTVTVAAADVTAPAIVASALNPTFGISGTVSYAGSKTGNVIVSVFNQGSTNALASQLVSLAGGSANYNIQGIGGGGNYEVSAEMDTLGNSSPNLSNPSSVVSTVTMVGASKTGINLTLTDPAVPTPVTPTLQNAYPGSGAAFVMMQNYPVSANGKEIASHYKVYWGTDAATATVGGSSKMVSSAGANNGSPIVIAGLANGSVLYFKVSALVGAVESAKSAVVGPITIGAVVGANTVSGTVTSTGVTIPASARMLTGMYSNNGVYFTTIAAPTNAQAFSVTGVPAGTYFHFAVIDMNGNGLIDAGDITNTNTNSASMVTVAGATTSNITLASNTSSLAVTTNYSAQWANYNLRVRSGEGTKRVVGVKLVSGPKVSLPADLATSNGNEAWLGLNNLTPAVGDTYGFKVTYSDGTSEIRTASVTGVLGANHVPTNLVSNAGALGASPTAPQFSWTAPVAAPASYSYSLWLFGADANWWQGQMPSSQLSVLYNENGNASMPNLTLGTSYAWEVSVNDANANSATSVRVNYVGVANPVALTPAQALASYLADVTSAQGVAESWATGPSVIATERRWLAAGAGVYNQSVAIKELTGTTWATRTTNTETYPAYYMNANTTNWTIFSGVLNWTLNANGTLTTVHPRVGNITMTIVGNDVSGTPINDLLTGAPTGSIYPPGSIAYTQTGAVSSLASFRIFIDPAGVVTNVNGVALTTAPTLSTTFCANGVLMRPLVPALVTGENYQAFMTASGSCDAASIAAATTLTQNVTLAQMPVLNASAPAVFGITTPGWGNTIVAAVPQGVYTGNYQAAGKNLGLIFDKNRTAANAEIIANGGIALP